jgi:hypothetical protein
MLLLVDWLEKVIHSRRGPKTVDNFKNRLCKPHGLTESFRRVREGRLKSFMVELRAAPGRIMPPRVALGVPIKEIGDVADGRGPRRRTMMAKRLFVGPARMTRTSRMQLHREEVI